MTLFDRSRPKHFLAFGHSNQSTFRRTSVQGLYDAISVPGTIATYFQQATGGFVLALNTPYFLDPRTPLFQANLQVIRASFRTLASAHGPAIHSAVERARAGDIALWDTIQDECDAREVAESWLEYQRNYVAESSERIDYYAELIGSDIGDLKRPEFFTSPYWMCTDIQSREWMMTRDMIEHISRTLDSGETLVPIIAWDRASDREWSRLLDIVLDVRDMGFSESLVWINDFREHDEPIEELRNLRNTVSSSASGGIKIGMLYGGYFSLCLGKIGLWSFGNGIGYSESRAFPELASTGGPRPRYYVFGIHRYLPLDIASRFLSDDPDGRLDLPHRLGEDPATLSHGDLMEHFVLARGAEISASVGRTMAELSDNLLETADYIRFRTRSSTLVNVEHLRSWGMALE